MNTSMNEQVTYLLKDTGITLNGPNPWDIQVHDERFYNRVLAQGSLGFGESYMDGWWDCERIDECLTRLFKGDIKNKLKNNWRFLPLILAARFLNLQGGNRAFEIGRAHYDLGNDLFEAMLDTRMVYSSGYWRDAKNLDEAQEAKLDLVCKKIGLTKGQRVLDIGCGWGSFAKFAAEKYGASVVGVTVSKEQLELAKKSCAGLEVEFRLQDYRELNEQFDHIISLGMFEHVGYKNYRSYMEVVQRCLKDSGLFLLHTIGSLESLITSDPWILKYIFPNSQLPSVKQIGAAAEGIFVMEDWHNFSADYDTTLMAWHKNFESAWPRLKEKYDERFYRMWRFYLLVCAGTFRARQNQLWQIVFSKKGVSGGYRSIR